MERVCFGIAQFDLELLSRSLDLFLFLLLLLPVLGVNRNPSYPTKCRGCCPPSSLGPLFFWSQRNFFRESRGPLSNIKSRVESPLLRCTVWTHLLPNNPIEVTGPQKLATKQKRRELLKPNLQKVTTQKLASISILHEPGH